LWTLPASGTVPVQQSGGTAGTDEVQVYHDGTRGYFDVRDGGLRVRAPNGQNYLEVYDLSGNVMMVMNGSSNLEVRGGIQNAIEPNNWIITGTGRVITRGGYDFRHPSTSVIDAGLQRPAASTVQVTTGTAGVSGDLILRNLTASGLTTLGTYTVATLPSAAANAGALAQVTDSSVTTNGSTVAGGGANRVPVFSDGTNWIVK
jgi:hypothetical protein